MEACLSVEQDLEKVLQKFRGLGNHTERVLTDAIRQIQDLKKEIGDIASDQALTPNQISMVRDTVHRCKEAVQHLAGEHRDVHASVSRVGKSVDRQLVSEYAAVAPRAVSFTTDENRRLQELAIAQHLYRQGLNEVGDSLVAEAGLVGLGGAECSGEPFATIQRVATALAGGDTAPALAWLHEHHHLLQHSPLPFTLHRLQMFKICRSEGGGAAIAYARRHLAALAARHERALQQTLCAAAWAVRGAGAGAGGVPPPPHYGALLEEGVACASASAEFVRWACAAVGVAGVSPLEGAVAAGARLLPALLDVHAKMTHPHVLAAWAAKDEMPLDVELGGGGEGGVDDGPPYHSVFACPILRQQASDSNPPMRLICGHVISRDALTKLAQGLKLKCPYCPTEQSPSEARQIYFS